MKRFLRWVLVTVVRWAYLGQPVELRRAGSLVGYGEFKRIFWGANSLYLEYKSMSFPFTKIVEFRDVVRDSTRRVWVIHD